MAKPFDGCVVRGRRHAAELSLTRRYRIEEAERLMKHQDMISARRSASAVYKTVLQERAAARRARRLGVAAEEERAIAQRVEHIREETEVLRDALEDVTVRLTFLQRRGPA